MQRGKRCRSCPRSALMGRSDMPKNTGSLQHVSRLSLRKNAVSNARLITSNISIRIIVKKSRI